MTLSPASTERSGSPMTVLVTGGNGFLMSTAIRQLLAADPEVRVVSLDLGPCDPLVLDTLGGLAERVTHVQGDVRDRVLLETLGQSNAFTHVLHAAAVTIDPGWEIAKPTWYIDVNIMGTVNVVDWARRLPELRRFVYVSSGAVYGLPTPESPYDPQPESGPFNPFELYSVTKYSAELICRRYGELYGMSVVRIRPTSVFGPMERATSARINLSLPYRIVRAIVEKRPFRVTPNSLAAAEDFVSSEDAACAIASLIRAPHLHHSVYNLGSGRLIPTMEMLDTFRELAPGFRYQVVDASLADVNLDPTHRRARWNAYDISRLAEGVCWRPRPLAEQLASYLGWVQVDPERRCPPLA